MHLSGTATVDCPAPGRPGDGDGTGRRILSPGRRGPLPWTGAAPARASPTGATCRWPCRQVSRSGASGTSPPPGSGGRRRNASSGPDSQGSDDFPVTACRR